MQATAPNCSVGNTGALSIDDYLECANFQDLFNGGQNEYMQQVNYIMKPNGWANVAANSDCVKKLVTWNYWQFGSSH